MSCIEMKEKTMINKWMLRITALFAIILLAACSLPEVTPIAETISPTETSLFSSTSGDPSPTTPPIPAPVEINSKNAASLAVTYKSAINNPQQLQWAADSASLAIATQNFDAAGNQLYGVTVLAVPDLTPLDIYSSQNERVSDISIDANKAALISLDENTFSVIELNAGHAVLLTITPGYLIGNVTFSPDGAILAVTLKETVFDETVGKDVWKVILYSASDGSEIKSLTGFETAAPIFQAGFKESPQWMVWLARGTLQLQEIESGNLGPQLSHEDFVMAYTLTNDGTIAASAALKTVNDAPVPAVILWDAAQGTELKILALNETAQCLAFSPNSSLLAVGVGSTVQIWDVTSGTMTIALEGHAGFVYNVAFSPDGKYIASAGQDNQLYLWQVSE